MLKRSSREDRRVKKESMLGLELSLMKYYAYKVLPVSGRRLSEKKGLILQLEAKLVHHCLHLASIFSCSSILI